MWRYPQSCGWKGRPPGRPIGLKTLNSEQFWVVFPSLSVQLEAARLGTHSKLLLQKSLSFNLA